MAATSGGSPYIDFTADVSSDEEAGPSNWRSHSVHPRQTLANLPSGSHLVFPTGTSGGARSSGTSSRSQTAASREALIEISSGEEDEADDDGITFLGVGAAPAGRPPPTRTVNNRHAGGHTPDHLIIRDVPVPGAMAGPARRYHHILNARLAAQNAERGLAEVEAEMERREDRRRRQMVAQAGFMFPVGFFENIARGFGLFGAAMGDPFAFDDDVEPPRMAAQANERMPDKFTTDLTHPKALPKPFSKDIIEPPLEVETYEISKNRVTGPLPSTTPICAGCDRCLVLGESGDRRIWALPCGHAIDGFCVKRLGGVGEGESVIAEGSGGPRKAARKGKQKASPRNSTNKSASATTLTFQCPVTDCKHDCTTAPGVPTAARPLFI